MSNKYKEIVDQSQFIVDLVNRLDKDILNDRDKDSYYYGGMKNHYTKQNDIVRIRRELKTLFDLLKSRY